MFSAAQLATLFTTLVVSVHAQSGTGVTTRYWDCCKTSCAWNGKASVTQPVGSCDKNNNPLADPNATSGCDGGGAFACADNSPWAIDDNLAYGFAAVNLSGETEADWCCSCYQLTFTSGPAAGKVMIVQATNTGGDVGGAQFDLMIPGGGVGIFTSGCTGQYGSLNGWGAQYGGVSSADQCKGLPVALQAGCNFRFGWFAGSDNPNVNWKKVVCPASLAARTGCVRTSEGTVSDVAAAAGATTTTTTSKISTTTTSATPKIATSTIKSTTTTTSSTASQSSTTSSASQMPVSSACSSATAFAQHWGQCEGIGYSGPTTCIPPYTCQYQNPWYSQCL